MLKIETDNSSETLATIVYSRLRSDIIAGVIAPGHRIRIDPLCKRLGIGLSPVREGLNRLATEGLIMQSDRRGFTAAPLDLGDLDDLTQARSALNAVALRDSIAQGDEAWEEAIILAHHRLARLPVTPRQADPQWETCHRIFHASLLAACRSSRIKRYCEQLFDATDRYRLASRRVDPGPRDTAGEHEAIMRAVVKRQADEAVSLLHDHVAHTAALVRRALADQPA